MAQHSFRYTILTLVVLTGAYACTGKARKENQSIPVSIPADTAHVRLEKMQLYNTVAFKSNTITHCAATEQDCRSDVNFIIATLELIDPDYKKTTLDAAVYQGTAVLGKNRDSLKITCYRIKTGNTESLQQRVIRIDTMGNGYVLKMARTEAPIACYFVNTPGEILLIAHIGLPQLQKIKNKPLVAAVKEWVSSK